MVFFDLEIGGFSKTADLLQIAAKHGDHSFSQGKDTWCPPPIFMKLRI